MRLEGQLDGQEAYSKGMYKSEVITWSDFDGGIQSPTRACFRLSPTWSCDFELSCRSSIDSSILQQREKIVFFSRLVFLLTLIMIGEQGSKYKRDFAAR